MFYTTIFVCFFGFVLAKSPEQNQPQIKFEITSMKVENSTKLICDHSEHDKQKHLYTVLEGKEFTIITDYNNYINNLICRNYNYNDLHVTATKAGSKNVTTFKAEKRMGALWKCQVLTNRDTPGFYPEVQVGEHTYAATHCCMQIHVRQTKSPQTILVNNMVLQAVGTDLSEKDVDFTAEYQYADGDVVNITCVNFNFLNQTPLTMEYEMAGTMSENSIMKDLSSSTAIGLIATLRSGHNNSYITCTNTEPNDYTKVMVRFIMRTEFNIVSIKINGMTLRPTLKNHDNNNYEIEYKYLSNQPMTVVCEVQQTNMNLVVTDVIHFVGKLNSYKRTDLIPKKKAEMSFYLKPTDLKTLWCSSDDNDSGASTEVVAINFTAGNLPIEQYPLHVELPSNGTVVQLYNDAKLKVIYYEFDDDETLQFKCGPLPYKHPGPVLYLQLKDSDTQCKETACFVSKTLRLTSEDRNTEIVCYLKEKEQKTQEDTVLKEIRVIVRKSVPTTTSTTTSTTTEKPIANTTSLEGSASPASKGKDDGGIKGQTVGVIVGAVLCIITICVSTVIVKLRKRSHSQGGPHNRNYENLQSPSGTSIPAYPPQWESNYAVPVDGRAQDTTYSVPCQEPALYSTPTPKHLRNNEQKSADPTYAVLEVPNAQGRKNTFKETDDPNYSEVYANRQEQCYAKVLPKSVRNNMAEDTNPYSYVTNEPPYVNTADPEPMYCEPAKAQGGTYANLNNSQYANSNAQEYVEPTYCEPQKRMK